MGSNSPQSKPNPPTPDAPIRMRVVGTLIIRDPNNPPAAKKKLNF